MTTKTRIRLKANKFLRLLEKHLTVDGYLEYQFFWKNGEGDFFDRLILLKIDDLPILKSVLIQDKTPDTPLEFIFLETIQNVGGREKFLDPMLLDLGFDPNLVNSIKIIKQ